jgi:DHA1 family tetracycline resistance protein-like MFS transporter
MMQAQGRRAVFAFAFITIMLDMLAIGAIAPVFVPLIQHFMNGDVPRTATVVGILGTCFALMQFLWSPFFGVLSDRFGRKPVMVISGLATALDYSIMALAPTLPWLFAGRILSGIASANATTASAYVADVTPHEKRAASFGMLGAAFGLGFILGPAIGGVLGLLGPRVPFWVAAGMSLANALFGAFVVPESLAREHRSRFTLERANPLGSFGLLKTSPTLLTLGALGFASALAGVVMPSTWVIYVTYRYGWGPSAIGLSLAAVGLTSVLVQALLTGPFVKRFGERAALIWGLTFGCTGLIVCGLAPSGPIFFLGLPFLSLWGLASAAVQSLMTRRVSPAQQGELQGAINSIRGAAALIGPLLFTSAFAFGIAGGRNAPGAAWFTGAVLLIIAIAAALPNTVLRSSGTDRLRAGESG